MWHREMAEAVHGTASGVGPGKTPGSSDMNRMTQCFVALDILGLQITTQLRDSLQCSHCC